MANVLIQKDGKIEYLESVNTGDYVVDPTVTKDKRVPKAGVLINPDVSAVAGVDKKYWKTTGNVVSEMIPAEKALVDNAGLALIQERKDKFEDLTVASLVKALIKAGVIAKEDLNG